MSGIMKVVVSVLFIVGMLLASTSPVYADGPATIDIVHQGNTTIVTVHGAWLYTLTADPAWTSVDFSYPDIIITFVDIDYGKLFVEEGGVLIQTIAWSKQWFSFDINPKQMKIDEKTTLRWGRHNSGRAATFQTIVPPGIVVPNSLNECEFGGGCILEYYFTDEDPQNLYLAWGGVSALTTGSFMFTTTFTETVSGYTETITDTLRVGFCYLPIIKR